MLVSTIGGVRLVEEKSEIELSGSIFYFDNKITLCFVFGWSDGAAPFLVWLKVPERETLLLC